jgi:hypothetical protein
MGKIGDKCGSNLGDPQLRVACGQIFDQRGWNLILRREKKEEV